MAELWKAPKRRSINFIHLVQLFFPTTCIHHHRTKDLCESILAGSYATYESSVAFGDSCRRKFYRFLQTAIQHIGDSNEF